MRFLPSAACMLLVLLADGEPGAAQVPPPLLIPAVDRLGVIDTIIVAGNKKTKDYVILDEMSLRREDTATTAGIAYNRSRIYSLGLFTRVDMLYDSVGTTRFLLVDVSERWYIIPFPEIGFREGDPKKIYYGAGLLHNNFQGRNQKLFGSVVFGYDPSLSLSFTDPLISRAHSLYFSGHVSGARVHNKSETAAMAGDYYERHYDLDARLGKRLTLYQTMGVSVGYRVIDASAYNPGRTVSLTGRDKFLWASVAYMYDTRDLREYAMAGTFGEISFVKMGFGEAPLSFSRAAFDFRRYFPGPLDLTLATRVFGSAVAGGMVPVHSHVYFGYGERIRGFYNKVLEGEDIAGATVELRYPLLKARTIRFTAIPLPEEFSVWRFGIALALFADAGSTWYRGDPITLGSFESGYGAGVHLLLPYGAVVRLEYARNEYGRSEFILDLRGSI
jgi:outer membrane protein assembly factor BamA